MAGFETCGIYPFNPQMISDDKLKTAMAHMAQTFDNDSSSESSDGDNDPDVSNIVNAHLPQAEADHYQVDLDQIDFIDHLQFSNQTNFSKKSNSMLQSNDQLQFNGQFNFVLSQSDEPPRNQPMSSAAAIQIDNTVSFSPAPSQTFDFINTAIRSTIMNTRTSSQKKAQKRRLIGLSGACITSEEAVAHLEAESSAKQQKIEDREERRRLSEENRIERERVVEMKRADR